MLQVTDKIVIYENELKFDFVRSSGPGGQNVNKVATAAQLRFDVANSSSLPDEIRQRLIKLAGKKMTTEGILVITAQRRRTQDQNRQDALNRLVALIRKASAAPKPRVRTKPSKEAKKRRLAEKRHRSKIKEMRRSVTEE